MPNGDESDRPTLMRWRDTGKPSPRARLGWSVRPVAQCFTRSFASAQSFLKVCASEARGPPGASSGGKVAAIAQEVESDRKPVFTTRDLASIPVVPRVL